jgi:hypothetical protein
MIKLTGCPFFKSIYIFNDVYTSNPKKMEYCDKEEENSKKREGAH